MKNLVALLIGTSIAVPAFPADQSILTKAIRNQVNELTGIPMEDVGNQKDQSIVREKLVLQNVASFYRELIKTGAGPETIESKSPSWIRHERPLNIQEVQKEDIRALDMLKQLKAVEVAGIVAAVADSDRSYSYNTRWKAREVLRAMYPYMGQADRENVIQLLKDQQEKAAQNSIMADGKLSDLGQTEEAKFESLISDLNSKKNAPTQTAKVDAISLGRWEAAAGGVETLKQMVGGVLSIPKHVVQDPMRFPTRFAFGIVEFVENGLANLGPSVSGFFTHGVKGYAGRQQGTGLVNAAGAVLVADGVTSLGLKAVKATGKTGSLPTLKTMELNAATRMWESAVKPGEVAKSAEAAKPVEVAPKTAEPLKSAAPVADAATLTAQEASLKTAVESLLDRKYNKNGDHISGGKKGGSAQPSNIAQASKSDVSAITKYLDLYRSGRLQMPFNDVYLMKALDALENLDKRFQTSHAADYATGLMTKWADAQTLIDSTVMRTALRASTEAVKSGVRPAALSNFFESLAIVKSRGPRQGDSQYSNFLHSFDFEIQEGLNVLRKEANKPRSTISRSHAGDLSAEFGSELALDRMTYAYELMRNPDFSKSTTYARAELSKAIEVAREMDGFEIQHYLTPVENAAKVALKALDTYGPLGAVALKRLRALLDAPLGAGPEIVEILSQLRKAAEEQGNAAYVEAAFEVYTKTNTKGVAGLKPTFIQDMMESALNVAKTGKMAPLNQVLKQLAGDPNTGLLTRVRLRVLLESGDWMARVYKSHPIGLANLSKDSLFKATVEYLSATTDLEMFAPRPYNYSELIETARESMETAKAANDFFARSIDRASTLNKRYSVATKQYQDLRAEYATQLKAPPIAATTQTLTSAAAAN